MKENIIENWRLQKTGLNFIDSVINKGGAVGIRDLMNKGLRQSRRSRPIHRLSGRVGIRDLMNKGLRLINAPINT